MLELRVVWIGRVPTRNVRWTFDARSSVVLRADLEEKKQRIWQDALAKNPQIYDGHVLVLLRTDETAKELRLETTEITFSQVLTLQHSGLGLDGLGTLGMQALLLSRDNMHALLGLRSTHSMYCPGYWATPGGMLEVSDVAGSFDSACMREIMEEAEVTISEKRDVVALVKELHGNLGCVMLLTSRVQSAVDVGMAVPGNEEWEGRQLRWVHLDDIAAIPAERALEGVLFLASEWRKTRDGEKSVLF